MTKAERGADAWASPERRPTGRAPAAQSSQALGCRIARRIMLATNSLVLRQDLGPARPDSLRIMLKGLLTAGYSSCPADSRLEHFHGCRHLRAAALSALAACMAGCADTPAETRPRNRLGGSARHGPSAGCRAHAGHGPLQTTDLATTSSSKPRALRAQGEVCRGHPALAQLVLVARTMHASWASTAR